MALMRTSRKGEDPTKKKNGVEPTKAQSEVKVTANTPGGPQKTYSWDEYEKTQDVKARNLAKRKQYESDVETYNKQMKLYKELEPKGVKKDLNTFFQGGGRYLNPTELESWNKEAETSGRSANMGGLKAKKVYVSKDYGKEGSISTLKTTTGKSYSGGLGAYHEWLGEPTKAVEQAYEKEEKIDINRVTLPGLETKKVTRVERPIGKIVRPKKEEKEEPTWKEPTGGVRTKTRYAKAKNQSLGDYIGGNIKYAASKLTGETPVLRGGVKKTREALFQGKTGKQAKEFKAYYGAPSSISGSDRSGMTASDIAQERESLKGVKKELRADIKKGGAVSKSELRSEIRNVRKDIKATKQAEKYASKNIEARSVYPGGKEEVILVEKPNAGSNPYRGSELGSKYSEFSKSQQIKKSTDNPANKNSTFGRKIKKS